MAVGRRDGGGGRLVVDVGDGDRRGLGGQRVGAVGERDRQVVDVVAAGVGRAVVVGVGREGHCADLAGDALGEVGRVVPAQRAVVGARGVGVDHREGLEGRCSRLGLAVGRCDGHGWRLVVDVGDGDRGGLGGQRVGAVRERDRDVVDVVDAGVGRALVVRGCCPYDGADLGADAGGEVRRVVPGQRARVGARGVRVGDGVGLEGRRCGLGVAVGRCDGHGWCLVVDVGDGDRRGLGGQVVGAVSERDGQVVDVVDAGVGRGFVVGVGRPCDGADLAGHALGEVCGVVPAQRAVVAARGVGVDHREVEPCGRCRLGVVVCRSDADGRGLVVDVGDRHGDVARHVVRAIGHLDSQGVRCRGIVVQRGCCGDESRCGVD